MNWFSRLFNRDKEKRKNLTMEEVSQIVVEQRNAIARQKRIELNEELDGLYGAIMDQVMQGRVQVQESGKVRCWFKLEKGRWRRFLGVCDISALDDINRLLHQHGIALCSDSSYARHTKCEFILDTGSQGYCVDFLFSDPAIPFVTEADQLQKMQDANEYTPPPLPQYLLDMLDNDPSNFGRDTGVFPKWVK